MMPYRSNAGTISRTTLLPAFLVAIAAILTVPALAHEGWKGRPDCGARHEARYAWRGGTDRNDHRDSRYPYREARYWHERSRYGGFYVGGIARYRHPGNGTYFYIDRDPYAAVHEARGPAAQRHWPPARIVSPPDASACSMENGVCVIRPGK